MLYTVFYIGSFAVTNLDDAMIWCQDHLFARLEVKHGENMLYIPRCDTPFKLREAEMPDPDQHICFELYDVESAQDFYKSLIDAGATVYADGLSEDHQKWSKTLRSPHGLCIRVLYPKIVAY